MEPAKGLNPALAAGGVVVLAILGAIAYALYTPAPPANDIPALDAGPDVAGKVSGAVESPGEKLPETNPFSGYKNPF